MTRKSKYTLGGIGFPNKKTIIDHAKSIKNHHDEEYEPITDEENIAFLIDLIHLHPNASEKIGSGIKYFTVGFNEKTGAREFQIFRTDESHCHFSVPRCVEKFNHLTALSNAARYAVKDQTDAFRQEQLQKDPPPVCPFHNVPLNTENAHADHQTPNTFAALLRGWMEENNLEVSDIPLADTGAWDTLGDEEQRRSWQEYHRTNATLRLVSIRANLSECRTTG